MHGHGSWDGGVAGGWRRDQMQKDTTPDREGFQAGCSHSTLRRAFHFQSAVVWGPKENFLLTL